LLCGAPRPHPVRLSPAHHQRLRILIEVRKAPRKSPDAKQRPGILFFGSVRMPTANCRRDINLIFA
jgi:hypothetical protein